jgi:hypothetical protein
MMYGQHHDALAGDTPALLCGQDHDSGWPAPLLSIWAWTASQVATRCAGVQGEEPHLPVPPWDQGYWPATLNSRAKVKVTDLPSCRTAWPMPAGRDLSSMSGILADTAYRLLLA